MKKMKLVRLGLGVLAASLLLAAGSSTALSGATDCSRIVVTGHPHYAPVSFAAGGTLEGGAIALVRRIGEDLGIPVTVIDAGSWDAAQKATADGKADIIVGIYKTSEREKSLAYVKPPIASDPSAVIAPAGSKLTYSSWSSLEGKKGLVSKGESYGAAFDAFMAKRLTVEKVDGFPALFAGLAAGTGEYGLIGYYAAITGAPKDKVRIVARAFVSEPMYIAFGRNSACRSLEPAFRRAVRTYVKNGTVDRLWKIGLADFEETRGK